jgi:hypothetical protein
MTRPPVDLGLGGSGRRRRGGLVLVDPSYRARGSSGAHARHSRSEAPGPVQEAPSLRSPRSAGRHLTRSVRCASARTPGIIDYDDHFFFAAWVLQAIFGVAHSISSQLRRPDPGSVRYSKRTSTRRMGGGRGSRRSSPPAAPCPGWACSGFSSAHFRPR